MSKKSMKQFNERKTAQKPMQNTQPKKVKKREVEAWILAIFMIAWTVCSVLGTIGFCRTQASAECADFVEIASIEEEMAVECSTAYMSTDFMSSSSSFSSVNLPEPYTLPLPFLTGITLPHDDALVQRVVLGSFSLRLAPSYIDLRYSTSYLLPDTLQVYDFDLADVVEGTYSYLESGTKIYSDDIYEDDFTASYTDPSFEYSIYNGYIPSGYTLSVKKDFQNHIITNPSGVTTLTDYLYTFSISLDWVDTSLQFQGSTVLEITFRDDYYASTPLSGFYIPSIPYYVDFRRMSNGSYYSVGSFTFDNSSFLSYMLNAPTSSFDTGYQQGIVDGKLEGEKIGYSQGFDKGKQQGYNEGKADGFTQGVAEANEYSFAGLLGAVFDAPVKAFSGLFTFDVLGIDIGSFLLSLLTACICLSLIKIFI